MNGRLAGWNLESACRTENWVLTQRLLALGRVQWLAGILGSVIRASAIADLACRARIRQRGHVHQRKRDMGKNGLPALALRLMTSTARSVISASIVRTRQSSVLPAMLVSMRRDVTALCLRVNRQLIPAHEGE
jgi:hypothetical protein